MHFLTSITYSDFEDLRMGSRKNPGLSSTRICVTSGGKDTVITNPNPDIQVYSGYNQLNTINKLRFRII